MFIMVSPADVRGIFDFTAGIAMTRQLVDNLLARFGLGGERAELEINLEELARRIDIEALPVWAFDFNTAEFRTPNNPPNIPGANVVPAINPALETLINNQVDSRLPGFDMVFESILANNTPQNIDLTTRQTISLHRRTLFATAKPGVFSTDEPFVQDNTFQP